MATRQILNKAADLKSELDVIDFVLPRLTILAGTVVENNVKSLDFMIETLPNNGLRPTIIPLFPANPTILPYDSIEEKAEKVQPVGYQRIYSPSEIEGIGLITMFVELDKSIALAMIDTAINRLKTRRKEIFKQTKLMLKKPGV